MIMTREINYTDTGNHWTWAPTGRLGPWTGHARLELGWGGLKISSPGSHLWFGLESISSPAAHLPYQLRWFSRIPSLLVWLCNLTTAFCSTSCPSSSIDAEEVLPSTPPLSLFRFPLSFLFLSIFSISSVHICMGQQLFLIFLYMHSNVRRNASKRITESSAYS